MNKLLLVALGAITLATVNTQALAHDRCDDRRENSRDGDIRIERAYYSRDNDARSYDRFREERERRERYEYELRLRYERERREQLQQRCEDRDAATYRRGPFGARIIIERPFR